MIIAFLFLGQEAQAAFGTVSAPELSCINPDGTVTLVFIPGAPNGDYSATFTPGGPFADLISFGDGGFGEPITLNFNIPSDESSGLSTSVSLDTDTLQADSDFTSTTVNVQVSPGDDLTSETGFGSSSVNVEITNDECFGEVPPTECSAEFSTNGLQPVGASFQDDKNFKKHTAVDGPAIADISGSVNYTISADSPRALVNKRQTLVLARNPGYATMKDLTQVTFVVTSRYSKDVPVKLHLSASDSVTEVMQYTHPQVLKGPFGLPCQDEERVVTLTFKLNKVLKPKPSPPAFKFAAVGAGEVKGIVRKVEDDSAVMTTATSFSIADTSMGTIGILPIGNPKSPNVTAIIRKLKKDAKRLATSLANTTPDFLPLPTEAINTIELNFLSFNPVDVSKINDKNGKTLQISKNLKGIRKMITLASEKIKASGKADIIISVFDSNTFSNIDDGGAAAFAYTGSAEKPGDVFVQTVPLKKRFKFGALRQRTEDAIHEIVHSYGFVGSGATSCPPAIHNVSATFADSCRITKGGNVFSSCGVNNFHIMGPSVPSAKISQCTYENVLDIFQGISTSENALTKRLTSQDASESLLVQAFISNGGNSATIEPIYDSAITADSFLSSATDTTWYFDLKNSGGNSVNKLYFELDFDNFAPEASSLSHVLNKHISLDDNFSEIELVNSNGDVIANKEFIDSIPSVEITSSELITAKGSKKKGLSLNLEWAIVDTSGEDDIFSTVFTGPSADNLTPLGSAFEISESSTTLDALDKDTKFVQVVITNGSRSAESEIVEL